MQKKNASMPLNLLTNIIELPIFIEEFSRLAGA